MPSGPLAILPLPGNRSSIVWSEPDDTARAIAALPAWAPTTSGYYRWGVEAASNALTLAASRPMRDASRWSVTSR